MAEIRHRIGAQNTSPEAVYAALTTAAGLAGWWTTGTTGAGAEPGDELQFRFPPVGGFDMRVTEAVPAKRVAWTVTDGPEEWIGTTIRWDLHEDGDWTIVRFAHQGWREPVEFMDHCSTKWATFLLSLKDLVETGSGSPAPADLQVSNWH